MKSLKVLTCFCEVTVEAATLEKDLQWQPQEIWFWQRRFDQAPDAGYRRDYAHRVIVETTRLHAMNLLDNYNKLATPR